MLPKLRWLIPILLLAAAGVLAVMPEGRAADWYIPTTRQALDPRIPLLKVSNPHGRTRGSAVLISMDDTRGWYITNHHMTPYGSQATYKLITPDAEYEAEFIKHDRSLDLGLLVADRPCDGVVPLAIAMNAPAAGSPVGIHGWTHGITFGFQEGHLDWSDSGWAQVSIGANQGQSGGAFMSDGLVVGITSRTNERWTRGASVRGIRRFLKWE